LAANKEERLEMEENNIKGGAFMVMGKSTRRYIKLAESARGPAAPVFCSGEKKRRKM
jgi:hypothetical protein